MEGEILIRVKVYLHGNNLFVKFKFLDGVTSLVNFIDKLNELLSHTHNKRERKIEFCED